MAVDFHAEAVELGFADAALEERTRVNAGRAVALDEEQVAGMVGRRRAPEMVEAHVVEGGAGSEAGECACNY